PLIGLYDLRAGHWGSLVLAVPLVPGAGLGNALGWDALGGPPADEAAYRDAVWRAVRGYLDDNRDRLGIDTAELGVPVIGSHENGRLVHVRAGRVVDGVPVRDSYVSATLNSGNLVLYGAHNWGRVDVSTTPSLGKE